MPVIIRREKTHGILETRPDHIVFEVVRDMPGRKRWKDGLLYFELTRANMDHLREHFPDAEWHKELDPLIERWDNLRTRSQETILDKRRKLDLPSFSYKTDPYAHQEKAFFLSRDHEVFGLFMEMGTGKTKVILDTLAHLYAAGELDGALIISPNGVHRQWVEEQIPTHLPDWVPRQVLSYVSPSKQRKAYKGAWTEMIRDPFEGLKILSMHIEGLSSKAGEQAAEIFLQGGLGRMMVVDESTRIKTPKAGRTKAAIRLGKLAKYRRIMSGAPVTKGVQDLFTQLKFLSEDILGYSSYWSFQAHFCVTYQIPGAPKGAVKITGYKNLDELTTAMEGCTYRVTKEECLDLPEKVYVTRSVEMSPEQKKAYYELRDDLITSLDDGTLVEAPMAAVKLMKMQQVLCGFLQPEEGPWVELPNSRVSETLEVLAETRGKTIVWARYRADLFRLGQALKKAGLGHVEYHGGVSSDDRAENIRKFREDPDTTVFLAQAQSGGTGLNLTAASTAIYFSNDFNADTRWQSEDRIHRIGQTNHCTYVDMVVPNSIDGKILKSLQAKKNIADRVIDLKEFLEEEAY